MFIRAIACAFSLVLLGSMSAQAAPMLIQQYGAWGAYSYQSESGPVCYVLSVPTSQLPANVDHGKNYFMVSRTAKGEEPEALMGYVLRSGSKVKVTIGDRTFSMFSNDDKAWVEDATDEPGMVAAMRSGHDMTLAAVSKRGTATSYTYSLSGITDALKKIGLCK
ncbi:MULTISPECIES: invasion associated locus B family protein [unclassified Sinorhizobium]|uniref:invasion associated locus B family protein n=1 Tax=unclassified Sinorhizobium TaxID=2613772 RepID=UPI0035242CCD